MAAIELTQNFIRCNGGNDSVVLNSVLNAHAQTCSSDKSVMVAILMDG